MYKYTLQDIADASGVPLNTVRDHKQQSLLAPESLVDVARYIAGWRAIKASQNIVNTDKTDIWGNPKSNGN